MATTPKRLYGPALLTGTTATKYTVPAGTKAIVRWIHIENNDAAVAYNLTLSIGADAAGTRMFDAYPIPAGAVYDWYPYLEMDTAEIIAAFASTTNKLGIIIGGDEITL